MKLGFAVIGAGYWGHHYIREIQQNKNAELKMVCDLRREQLDLINEQYPHIKTTTNYQEIVNNKNIDAVIVCTQVKTHHKIVKELLEAGKNVLCEKVLTFTEEDAKDLIQTAVNSNKKLGVCHTFEYNSCVKYMKKVLDEKVLGETMYFHFKRTGMSPIRQDVSAMWDLAAHDISILLYLLDEMPISVKAFGKSYLQDGLEDVMFINLEFPNDIIANIHCSWIDPIRQRKITAVGRDKILVFDDSAEKDKVIIHNFEGVYIPNIQYKQPIKENINDFIYSIIDDRRPQVDGIRGMNVVKVLEMCQASLKKNQS